MPKTEPGDHNTSPENGTFASRRAERAGKPTPPRRRTALRAGVDAETDFEITGANDGGDRVQQIRT